MGQKNQQPTVMMIAGSGWQEEARVRRHCRRRGGQRTLTGEEARGALLLRESFSGFRSTEIRRQTGGGGPGRGGGGDRRDNGGQPELGKTSTTMAYWHYRAREDAEIGDSGDLDKER
jgi:hypothetical protein